MKIILLIILFIFPSYVFGEWKEVSKIKHDNGSIHTLFVDYSRIINNFGFLYVWSMDNHTIPDPDGFKSYILYQKIDCKLRRNKDLIFHYFKENMGKSSPSKSIKYKENQVSWNYPIPNRMEDNLIKSVCK